MRFTLLLLLPCLAAAQDEAAYNAYNIPDTLLTGADAVVRSREMTFTVSSADNAVLHEKRAVTLFNGKSDYNKLILHYDSFNKIGKIRGSLYDASGQFIRDIEKKEVKDQSAISDFSIYEDSRVRYLEVNHDRYPYTVVFEYDMKFHDLRGYPTWDIQSYNTAVENSVCRFVLPRDMKLYHKALNINISPEEKIERGDQVYEWRVHNLPAIGKEPYAPSAYDLLPCVLISPDLFQAERYTGSMASWKDLGLFQFELSKGRDKLSPQLKSTVRELTAGLATEKEKIAVLYRYLQQNTRYVSVQLGIGGWQPFDANYVEKNKFGDCKALSNFMKALLKEAGIASNPALVKYGDDCMDLSDNFATVAFNHMILYVPSQSTWLECTSSSLPPNYLGSGTDDREVLLITEQGGKIARTPALPTAGNLKRSFTDITLQNTGEAVVAVRSTLSGSLHEWYRGAAEYYTPEELQKEMQKKNPLPQAYYAKLNILPSKDAPEAGLEYEMRVPQFGSKAGKRFFLPVNPVNALREIPPANEKRVHPVAVHKGFVEQDTVLLHLPEGYTVESIPSENTSISTEFGSYSGQVIRQDRSLLFIRRLEILPVRLPADRYTEWRNFYRDVAKADGMKVVLVNKT